MQSNVDSNGSVFNNIEQQRWTFTWATGTSGQSQWCRL